RELKISAVANEPVVVWKFARFRRPQCSQVTKLAKRGAAQPIGRRSVFSVVPSAAPAMSQLPEEATFFHAHR
ncbi:MAG: hypothetical protein WBD49_06985, partial [Bradyrhizobium sp.]